VAAHLQTCVACAAEALDRAQLKRAVSAAGNRYAPSAELRQRIAASMSAKPRRQSNWYWKLVAAPAIVVLIISLATSLYVGRETTRRDRVYSELIDLHVASIAASTPVDVVSSDRHTVKPWFQGKLPFTFDLPELQGTGYTLIGGRVAYLEHEPGAHLLYDVGAHHISVFIFRDRSEIERVVPVRDSSRRVLSFHVESWASGGLRYFVFGDASPEAIQGLSRLLKQAGA
jgi:anti-sigma factor RsiW